MKNISKMVISKNDASVVGYVLNIVLDKFELVGYVVVDEETESEYFLSRENILCVSDKYLMIKNVDDLEFLDQPQQSLLGLEVLDDFGVSYGEIIDLKFFKNKCEKIITKKCEILTKNVKNIGKNFVFISFKKKKKEKVWGGLKNNSEKIVVKIQNNFVPEKINLSTSYYVGRVCLQDVFGYNNERIASVGDVVDKKIVENAKKHNRLNQLFFAIKRG